MSVSFQYHFCTFSVSEFFIGSGICPEFSLSSGIFHVQNLSSFICPEFVWNFLCPEFVQFYLSGICPEFFMSRICPVLFVQNLSRIFSCPEYIQKKFLEFFMSRICSEKISGI